MPTRVRPRLLVEVAYVETGTVGDEGFHDRQADPSRTDRHRHTPPNIDREPAA
jgi:hypothetical protein